MITTGFSLRLVAPNSRDTFFTLTDVPYEYTKETALSDARPKVLAIPMGHYLP